MDEQDAEKLRFTTNTGGWKDVYLPYLEARIVALNRKLIANPDQRTAGYLQALIDVLAWSRLELTAHDEERLVKPPEEPRSIGDPYRETANS